MSNRIVFLVCLMLTTAMLWPSEGAIGGDGLQLVIGWLAVGLYALAAVPWRGKNSGWLARFPVLLLVAGFWLSTWHVFQVDGDRRSALNLAFEWTAIGMAWWLVRQMKAAGVRLLLLLIVGLGAGVSALGIVQYHVTNKQQAEWYLGRLESLAVASPSARQTIEADLQRMGVPSEGGSRELFERRLLASSEPVGPFALANTLGGVLAVVLILLTAGVVHEVDSRDRTGLMFWVTTVLLLAIVGYCLLLTKSRTAWVGSLAGLAYLFGQRMSSFSAWLKRAAVVAVIICVAGGIGIVSGAIDREVVLESPKSLQYRLFYWMGASGVIAESPVFGAGPGNFRQSYLKYKVPESSEEILDPHNILVDAWCTAGLTGLLAVLLMIVGVLRRSRRDRGAALKSVGDEPPYASSLVLVRAVCVGAIFHLAWRWIGGGPFWDLDSDFFLSQNLILIVPAVACVSLMLMCRSIRIPIQAAGSAFVCLLVHLLGAGGLQISICGLLLVILYAIRFWDTDSTIGPSTDSLLLRRSAILALAVVLVAVGYFGLKPVVTSGHQLLVASAKASAGDENAAAAAYREAISCDPLSVESRQRNAEFLAYSLLRTLGQYAPSEGPHELPETFKKQYDICRDACADLIASDRRGTQGYLIRSQIRRTKGMLSSDDDVLRRSIHDLEHVLSIYPSNAAVWAELAVLCEQTGDRAKSKAACEKALAQEKINRDWGHADRFLNEKLLQDLSRIGLATKGDIL